MKRLTVLLLLVACVAGCTTTRWKRIDELGAVMQGRQNTFFAKTDLSAITAKVEGDKDGGYKMDIGSSAKGADSTDALKGIEFLTELVRVVGPILGQAATAPKAEDPAPTVIIPKLTLPNATPYFVNP